MKKKDNNQLSISLDSKNDKSVNCTLYLYTNRDNLLIYLASGFIMPKNLNMKYYSDFSSSLENGLILLKEKLSFNYLNSFSESENSFPVCIQMIIPENFNGEVSFILPDYRLMKANFKDAPEDFMGLIIPGIITLRPDYKISFYDKISLEEFTAREFEDIKYDHFDMSVDPDLFNEGIDFKINKILSIPELQIINQETYINTERLAALLTVMEKAASDYPGDFLLNLMHFYSLYFENFSSQGLRKLNYTPVSDIPDTESDDLNNFILIIAPFVISNKIEDPKEGFNKFVKDFKLSKKLNQEKFIHLFSAYCIISAVVKFDSSNRNYIDYFNEFRDIFINNLTKSKRKIDKEELPETEKIILKGIQFLNSEVAFNEFKNLPEKYTAIKYFLLFLKRFDYENTSEYERESDEYDISIRWLLFIQQLSAIWSGYPGLTGKLKEHKGVTYGAFDSLCNYISNKEQYVFPAPKIGKDISVREFPEFELITKNISGIYGYKYSFEKKDYHTGISKLITENEKPENVADLIELAKILELPKVVLYSASVKSNAFVEQRNRDGQTIFYSHSPFNTKTEFSFERFKDHLKERITEKDLMNIPLQLKKNIAELYKKTGKDEATTGESGE